MTIMTNLEEKTQKDRERLMEEIHEVTKKIDIQKHYRLLAKRAHTNNEPKSSYQSSDTYYCNCCGCTFQADSDDQDEIRCPECGCLYDEDNGFIEKTTGTK